MEITEATNGTIIIAVEEIAAKGTVTVTYSKVDIPDGTAGNTFTVETRTRTRTDAVLGDENFVPIKEDAVTGGIIKAVAGSGQMASNRMTVEKGSSNNAFTLTYKAATKLTKATLIITRPDPVLTDFSDSSAKEGYVSTPDGGVLKPDSGTEKLVVTSDTITWNGLTLDAGKTFRTNIRRLKISDLTGEFFWAATLNGDDIDDDPKLEADGKAMLTVVGRESDDVAFEIVDPATENPDAAPTYPAASEQMIGFRFSATNTAIQEGGSVWLTIPGSWSPPFPH